MVKKLGFSRGLKL